MPTPTTSQSIRAELMAPEPIKRVYALHALEVELEAVQSPRLAREVTDFAARGVPYYAPQDPHYCEWVGKAVTYWEQMHDGVPGAANASVRPGRRRKAG